jgi:dTDP-4-dehydrorhamnose reductase
VSRRILVTGVRGLLGQAIVEAFSTDSDVTPLDRAALDVTDSEGVTRAIAAAHPEVVINCAAYNDVDGAESDAVSALQVNALAVRTLAAAARAAGAVLVHYSTDFVFDGETGRPYTEQDTPNPRGIYAASKLLGEWFALEHPRGYVLRVESLFGRSRIETGRQGSLATVVARIRSGTPVPVFIDRTVSPSYTADVAQATRAILAGQAAPGLYHCVNSGAATWAEIAAEAARLLGLPLDIAPITLETAALRAARPRYSALSNAKLEAAGVPMRRWPQALASYLAQPLESRDPNERHE